MSAELFYLDSTEASLRKGLPDMMRITDIRGIIHSGRGRKSFCACTKYNMEGCPGENCNVPFKNRDTAFKITYLVNRKTYKNC